MFNKQFGFRNIFLRNVRMNKWILLYLLVSISFPVIISYLFTLKKLEWMTLSIILYVIILRLSGEQHKRKMIKLKPKNSLGYFVRPFGEMLYKTQSQLMNKC